MHECARAGLCAIFNGMAQPLLPEYPTVKHLILHARFRSGNLHNFYGHKAKKITTSDSVIYCNINDLLRLSAREHVPKLIIWVPSSDFCH